MHVERSGQTATAQESSNRLAGTAPGAFPGRIAWVVLGLCLAAVFAIFCYTDLILIIRHSLGLIEAVVQGRPLSFYSHSYSLPIFDQHVGEVPYDIWVYIVFALWNIPVYLFELISNRTFEYSIVCLVWNKLLLVGVFILANWALARVCRTLGRGAVQTKQTCFLFSSSIMVMNGLFCLAQIDIFAVFFLLMGLDAYLKADRRGTYLWFALAVTMKVMPLICVFPLILLREKRWGYIIRDTLVVCSLSLLSKLIFFTDKMNTPTQFDEVRFSTLLLGPSWDIGSMKISLFIVVYLCLLVFCYLSPEKEEEQLARHRVLWVCAAAFGCFFLFATTYPYWVVLLAPFVVLLATQPSIYGWLNLVLEIVVSASHLVWSWSLYSFCYAWQRNLGNLLPGLLFGRADNGYIPLVVLRHIEETLLGPGSILLVAQSLFFVCLILLLFLNRPGRKAAVRQGLGSFVVLKRPVFMLRLLGGTGLVMLPFIEFLLLALRSR